MSDGAETVGVVVLGCGLVVGLFLFIDWLFMLAWNFVMPGVGLPELRFWQAVCLLFVVGMLTGGLRASTSSKE